MPNCKGLYFLNILNIRLSLVAVCSAKHAFKCCAQPVLYLGDVLKNNYILLIQVNFSILIQTQSTVSSTEGWAEIQNGGFLLHGTFDENESAKSFQEALNQWRSGNCSQKSKEERSCQVGSGIGLHLFCTAKPFETTSIKVQHYFQSKSRRWLHLFLHMKTVTSCPMFFKCYACLSPSFCINAKLPFTYLISHLTVSPFFKKISTSLLMFFPAMGSLFTKP